MKYREWHILLTTVWLLSALFLGQKEALVALSQPLSQNRREALMVLDFPEPGGERCAEHLRQVLVQSQRFNVWPRWYSLQRLEPEPDLVDSSALLSRLTELNYLVQGHLRYEGDYVTLSVVMTQGRESGPVLVFADLASGRISELIPLCESLATRILGEALPAQPRSPALAASLSLIMPGAGHLYLGKPINLLLGSAFLGGYLSLAWMGIRPQQEGGLSRQQWGGLLLLLTLTDILMAYFLSLPEPMEEAP